MSSPRIAWRLYILVCFGLFLLFTFPSDLLLRRVVVSVAQHTAIQLRYAVGDWTWHSGWVLQNLTIEHPVLGTTPLQLTRLTLLPSLSGLFYNQPFPFTFSANLYGGTADGTVRQEAIGFGVQFALHGLAIEQWPLPALWGPGHATGSVTVDGIIQGHPAELASWRGSVTATVTNGTLRAGTIGRFPLPALQPVQARLHATLTSGRVEISDLTVNTNGVEAHLQGLITLRMPVAWSALDLQFTTRITGSPVPALTSLISLLPPLPGTTNERRASISGSLVAPVMR